MPELETRLLERLLSVLEEEVAFYREMSQIAQRKQEMIVENQVEDLLEIVDEEMEKAEGLDGLEEERVEIFQQLMGDGSTLSDLIKYLGLSGEKLWEDRFSEIREELLELLFELQSQNERNKVLVEEALTLNQFTMNILRQVRGKRAQKYDKRGQSLEDEQSGLINRQV
ncbi:MAG: flagellar protein FlgN [Halanaerobium sp.]|nr:flagellar protein FlgN [Halanaerobium sp.]